MQESKEEDFIKNEVYNRDSKIYKIDNVYTISKSTLLIESENIVGTGFFIKFMKINKPLYCLMTSEHIINSEMIDNKKSIDILYENKTKKLTIELNKNERIIRTFIDIGIDATIIEILEKDQIKEDYFLSPCDEEDYDFEYKNLINAEIQIIQFPEGENLSYSKGKILKINKYRFSNNASTLSGSSGSPIALFGKEKVIGIHKGGNEDKSKNYGDLIVPINAIINQLKKNGEGIEYYENGNKKYEGNFLNDEYEGYGTFFYENGDSYIGYFKNGKKEGSGIIIGPDGNIKEDGIYKDDKLIEENNEENNEENDEENNEENNEDNSNYENSDDNKSDSENEIKKEEKEEVKRKTKEKKRKKVDFDDNNSDSNSSLKNKDKFNSEENNNSNNLTD